MGRACWNQGREKRLTYIFWRIPYSRVALLGGAMQYRWRAVLRVYCVNETGPAHGGTAQRLALAYAIDLWRALRSDVAPYSRPALIQRDAGFLSHYHALAQRPPPCNHRAALLS